MTQTNAMEQQVAATLAEAPDRAPEAHWAELTRRVLDPHGPLEAHVAAYRQVYQLSEADGFPQPAWMPDAPRIERAHVTSLARELGVADADALHLWSIAHRERFWGLVIERLGVRFARAPERMLDASSGMDTARWLPGASLNIVESCFQAEPAKPAIVADAPDGTLRAMSYGELRALVNRLSNGLASRGVAPGDAVGLVMAMTPEAVAAYLAIVQCGAVAVTIPESFAAPEIARRCRIANVKLVLAQHAIDRGGKRLPLYEKVRDATDAPVVVMPDASGDLPALRAQDACWSAIESDDDAARPVMQPTTGRINVLFSSGTTGDPKAIPWHQITPIKCAADAMLFQDVHADDVVCWPTGMGWMMGPWLVYASLLNGATMALHHDAPTGDSFVRFVERAGVTVLGVVPSLVRAWRADDRLAQVDWRGVRTFSSTGECSDAADMFYLCARAGYRPIIEYCGGTELAGGYIGCSVTKPTVPGAFSLPACGVELVIVDEWGEPASRGEAFLRGPAIGFSWELLNADHHEVYYAATPRVEDHDTANPLRRHGDVLERLPGGYYRALGRADDTMNLGGIKVSSAEIERVAATLASVREAAAVAVEPAGGGGPSKLVVFVVPEDEPTARAPDGEALRVPIQQAIRAQLNPLFKVDRVVCVDHLPRTASNKVMRRELRKHLSD